MGKSRVKRAPVPQVLTKLGSSGGSGRITKSTARKSLQIHSTSHARLPSSPDKDDLDLELKARRGLGIRRFDGVISSQSQVRSQDSLRAVVRKVPLKKVRRKQKKDEFRKRIQTVKELEQEAKKAIERARTVIVGDMNPLLQALPESITTPAEGSQSKKLKRPTHDHEAQAQADMDSGVGAKMGRKKIKVKRRDQEIAESLEYFSTGLAALAAKKAQD